MCGVVPPLPYISPRRGASLSTGITLVYSSLPLDCLVSVLTPCCRTLNEDPKPLIVLQCYEPQRLFSAE